MLESKVVTLLPPPRWPKTEVSKMEREIERINRDAERRIGEFKKLIAKAQKDCFPHTFQLANTIIFRTSVVDNVYILDAFQDIRGRCLKCAKTRSFSLKWTCPECFNDLKLKKKERSDIHFPEKVSIRWVRPRECHHCYFRFVILEPRSIKWI